MTVGSRRASSQIVQRGPSARLKQISQGRMSALTSRIASERALASSSVLRRMWKARRCAVRAPMPGSRPSSVMRRWTGGACSVYLFFCARRAARLGAPPGSPPGIPPPPPGGADSAAEPAERLEHRVGVHVAHAATHLGGRELLDLAQRLVDRRGHEVLQHLDVLGIDGVGVDRDRLQAQVAGRDDLHHPAAGGRLDALLLQRLLGLLLLGHHLLGLLEHLVQVRWLRHQAVSSGGASGMISSASNSVTKRATHSSSVRGGGLPGPSVPPAAAIPTSSSRSS